MSWTPEQESCEKCAYTMRFREGDVTEAGEYTCIACGHTQYISPPCTSNERFPWEPEEGK